jgi:hypothetical protein
MGNIPCCDRRPKNNPEEICKVILVTQYNRKLKTFEKITVASTPRSRHKGYHDRVPSDNECLLLPSSVLPSRLRSVYSQRSCTPLTILFCEKLDNKSHSQNHSTFNTSIYRVQEQVSVTPQDIETSFTPNNDGDLIVQCGQIEEHIAEVHIVHRFN